MGSHQQQHDQIGEGENYTNTLTEHHVQSAIEMGLQSRQQTYQEFMDSFLFLTKEDVQKYNEAKLKKELEKMELDNAVESMETAANQQKPPILSSAKLENKLENFKIVTESEDDLDTEELGEGTISPRCTDAEKFGGAKKFVQFDNFVDDDGSSCGTSDEEDIIEYGEGEGAGYVSSFGQVDNATSGLNPSDDTKEEGMTQQESIEAEESEEEHRMISPLPGEAEDIPTDADNLSNIVHQTQLDMCVKKSPDDVSATQGVDQQEMSEETANEVQPFSLDENFDYDNVVLSKKWDFKQETPNLPT